jgi:hypothetical protein
MKRFPIFLLLAFWCLAQSNNPVINGIEAAGRIAAQQAEIERTRAEIERIRKEREALRLKAERQTAPAAPSFSVRKYMSAEEFQGAGLNKLTAEELGALDHWFVEAWRSLLQQVRSSGLSSSASPSAVPGSYPLEASVNDETFIINGEAFKAKTYCFNMNKGDPVKFVDGNASGVCVSAKLLNLRTGQMCEVWCE